MENVLIVGAGPVGLMLACELSLAGVRPIVLDKNPGIGDLPKANGLVGQIVETLDHRGLLERFSAGSPYAGPAPGFPFASVPLRFEGVPDIPLRVLVIQQPRLERLLTERALELGADIRRGCEVLALAQDAEGVTLTTGQGELRARYAVGCDGGHSRVREAAGIGFPGDTDEERLIIGHFKTGARPLEEIAPAGMEPGWNRTRHGRVLLTSLQQGVLVAGVRERGAPPRGPVTLEMFQTALRRHLGRELPLGEPIWLSTTVAQARLAERYRAGRVFLAGEDGDALRELLGEVFAFEEPVRHLAGLLYDSGVRYAPGAPDARPPAGGFVPDLELADGRRVAELLRSGRPVLLDLGGGTDGLTGDDDWIEVVHAAGVRPPADALLIRPDGYVAWAGADGLAEAAGRWFGAGTASRA
ncbi:FAD-dependent monooxygenase [Nonomuraea wenchangensis]|uniref:2-polyprenyl-6-methoxyphenol hydroxylase n=1 Tax=Nonomuraea wenchangensis TaxID=568860 RepID=A0A1I0HUJ4_9ACTN|nr:FAD-dependent monooxygenase [Nonomuraea wenchangensis]SET87010.1 2-polyprenyl-6-methoxyphenol hydroxylase [Nonomuraea wenchangensis]